VEVGGWGWGWREVPPQVLAEAMRDVLAFSSEGWSVIVAVLVRDHGDLCGLKDWGVGEQ